MAQKFQPQPRDQKAAAANIARAQPAPVTKLDTTEPGFLGAHPRLAWGLGIAIIMLVTLAVYIPATRAEYIWDDDLLLTNNVLINADDGIVRFWTKRESSDYFPITYSMLWLEWRIYPAVHDWMNRTMPGLVTWWQNAGLPMHQATPYHVVNVVFHGLSAALLWLVLRRLKVPAAWLIALLFALHPVNVASVAWVSERKNTLSMVFYLLTFLTFLRFEATTRWRWYAIAVLMFLAALLSKTSVVMVPVVLLLIAWWKHGRISLRDIALSLPFFVMSGVLGLVTIFFQRHGAIKGENVRPEGWPGRIAGAGRAFVFYMRETFLPYKLAPIYTRLDIAGKTFVEYIPTILVIVGLLALLYLGYRWKVWRHAAVSAFYVLFALFPILGFFDTAYVQYSLWADHWQYLAIIGTIAFVVATLAVAFTKESLIIRGVAVVVAVLLAAGQCWLVATHSAWSPQGFVVGLWNQTGERPSVDAWPVTWIMALAVALGLVVLVVTRGRRFAFERGVGVMAAAAVVGSFAVLTWNQSALYKDQETLWADNVAKYPDCWMAWYNRALDRDLAEKYAKDERYPVAEIWYRRALDLNPKFAPARLNYANVLYNLGRPYQAMAEYRTILVDRPYYAEVHNNMGMVLNGMGRTQEALESFKFALRCNPNLAQSHFNLANILANANQLQEAISEYEQTIRLKPDFYEAYHYMGLCLSRLGRSAAAMSYFKRAVQMRPTYPEGYISLGQAFIQVGQYAQAVACYRQAVALQPDSPVALNALARLMATCPEASVRDGAQAMRFAIAACSATKYQNAVALDTLAAAYAEAGRFEEALSAARNALNVARAAGSPGIVSAVEAHIGLYEKRLPLRESYDAAAANPQ